MGKEVSEEFLKTCFMSSYPPRECGIASFSKDLCTAMDRRFNPRLRSKVIALNEKSGKYPYKDKVVFEITREDIEHYLEMAKRINESEDIKILCIQHEFGLFGGDYGCYLVPFLEMVNKPIVVVFHTVLPKPSHNRKKIVQAIANRVSAIIVIAEAAIDILEKDYDVPKEKIHMVHHGIPNVVFQDNIKHKEDLGLKGKIVLCSHGLLSRGKGVEYAIKALPDLKKKYPNIVYLIIGKTHPGAEYEHGKKYKEELEELVDNLNLKKNVIFIDKYVSLKALIKYILASDIYLFTNLEKEQISSGALARAFGCGRAIIATPVRYAEELLQGNRGIIVGMKDHDSFTEKIDLLLSNPKLKREIEKNSYFYSRQMIWSNVAFSYLKIFNKIVRLRDETTEKFPEIKLDHLKRLSDNVGVIQFSEHTTPDKKSGYTLDDNARALMTSVLYHKFFRDKESLNLTKNYLEFIKNAQDKEGNIKNQHKNPEEISDPYSDDAFGRGIWALGFTINKVKGRKLRNKAKKIFDKSFKRINKLESPRAIAFSIMGLVYYYKKHPNKKTYLLVKKLSESLVSLYDKHAHDEWRWFEPNLTYCNAQLPKALFLGYSVTKNKKHLDIAKKSLGFLSGLCIVNGKLQPIGQNGWYNRGNRRAFFDQQPVDAFALVQAFIEAYRTTKDRSYYNKAILAFNWFLGHNHLDQMIYDEATGGCFDGLGQHSLNFNQGAESTICYLLARLSIEEMNS